MTTSYCRHSTLSLQNGKYITSFCLPLCKHRGINYPPSARRMVHPFSPERSFVLAIFPLVIFCILIFIEENIPLTPCKTMCFTPSQESNLDSCRPMSPSAYRPESCKATLADNEHQPISTIFPSPTLSVEVMMVCTSCSST